MNRASDAPIEAWARRMLPSDPLPSFISLKHSNVYARFPVTRLLILDVGRRVALQTEDPKRTAQRGFVATLARRYPLLRGRKREQQASRQKLGGYRSTAAAIQRISPTVTLPPLPDPPEKASGLIAYLVAASGMARVC